MDNTDNRSTLSLTGTLSLAIGFAIGSGIITQTGIAISMTGRSVALAFLLSAVLFLISFRPLFIMSSLLPKTSAAYCYSKELIHPDMGILHTYVYFLGRIAIAIFGISFAQYLASLLPFFESPGRQRALALALLTVFYIVNLFGIRFAARVQNVMCIVLIGGILTFIFAGIGKVDFALYVQEDFLTNGFQGLYSASSLLFFAVSGAYIITDFAPTIKNASRVMVKVIYGVTIVVTLLYTLMGIVASGTVSVPEAAGKPLTVAAQRIMGHSGAYAFFVVGACIGALITTLNSSFVWYSNSLIRPCLDGMLPKKWAKNNRHGVPFILMTIFYLFGAIPTILGIDLEILSKAAIGLTILSACIPMMGVLQLPKKYPELWKNSKYAARYPRWRRISMVVLSYGILATQVISLFKSNPLWSNILIVGYVAIVVICILLKRFLPKRAK